MLVKELMTTPVRTCRPGTLLGTAAREMLEEECGCLPVTDSQGRLAGLLTDRDICVTVGARHRSPWEIPVKSVMKEKVFTCNVDDHIDAALATMKERRVRRLPVVDRDGHVKGLLSVDDLIRNTGIARGRLMAEPVMDVLRAICTPQVEPEEAVTT